MCELFGVSSKNKVQLNEMLKEFASHSVRHPNGWGMAVFYGNSVSLEKEPVPACKSVYLRERLRHTFRASNMIAHIRLATRGTMDFENCHPFVMRDNSNRTWTLAHNGTIFDCPVMTQYVHTQEGQTDSERILCHLIDLVDTRQEQLKRPLDAKERFRLVDEMVCSIALHNKLNLLIYDSEQFYVHTNYANSLYVKQSEDTAFFATVPLDRGNWKPAEFTTLLGYKDGRQIFTGTNHGQEYIDNPKDMQFIFVDYASL
ncbi:MAG: class II glutamine amidotransferase [Fusicatenibacter sp.]|nr:class II glutamine amidotransferase [Fusicatenibacter sp.]